MSYRKISDFASGINNISDDPLTYCLVDSLDSQFLHGTTGRTFGKNNRQCAIYMSNRCAGKWDNICEVMSECSDSNYPDMTNNRDGACARLGAGDLLLKDTAYLKYLLNANGSNVQCEPFDPTVANSPSICYINHSSATMGDSHVSDAGVWINGEIRSVPCAQDGSYFKEYGLTLDQIRFIDNDPVMSKLIDRPWVAPELMNAIYLNLKKKNFLQRLSGTKVGGYYGLG